MFIVKDSDRGLAHVGGHRIFACTYLPSWQRIRMQTRFKEPDKCKASLNMLDMYVLSVPRGQEHERALRRWRVYNMLNALPIGLFSKAGMRQIHKEAMLLVIDARRRYKRDVNSIGYPSEWDWAESRAETIHEGQSEEGLKFLKAMHKNFLAKRAYKGKKLELQYYLRILEEVLNAA